MASLLSVVPLLWTHALLLDVKSGPSSKSKMVGININQEMGSYVSQPRTSYLIVLQLFNNNKN